MKSIFYIHFFLLFLIAGFSSAQEKTTFRGTVFLDENANGIFDKIETCVKDVCISNGKEVVQTNEKGEWQIDAGLKKSIFVIKPAGFAIPVNQYQIPLHFVQSAGSTSSVINFFFYPSFVTRGWLFSICNAVNFNIRKIKTSNF